MDDSFDELEIEDQVGTKTKGLTYDTLLHQSIYDALKNVSMHLKENSSESLLSCFSEIMRIHFVVVMKCQNEEYVQKFFPNIFQKLKSEIPNLERNQVNRINFYISLIEWQEKLADEIRKLGFVSIQKAGYAMPEWEETEQTKITN